MTQQKKKALGRGLSAILESPETDITSRDISGEFVVGAIASIPVIKIETNPFQPREDFDEEALEDLTESIREQGIIQPLTVRKMGFDRYQLISGERRLRSAKLAGLREVPAYIRVANDEQMLEWALIENIQRENLNAIEVALSYQRLLDECRLTQEELSKKVGKSRATVANFIRLLKLPGMVQSALRDGQISMGHARAFITLDNPEKQIQITRRIIQDDLSVRQVEKLVRLPVLDDQANTKTKAERLPENYGSLQNLLINKLDTKVLLKRGNNGTGTVVISFKDDNDLERIISKFGV
jgi:ParB family transcriptional regulator, chromosome partitioning protein